MRRSSGLSLVEILAVMAIAGVIAIASAPAFANYRRNASMKAEVAELRGILRAVRSRAIMRGTHAGVKFTRAGNVWVYSLYDHGLCALRVYGASGRVRVLRYDAARQRWAQE